MGDGMHIVIDLAPTCLSTDGSLLITRKHVQGHLVKTWKKTAALRLLTALQSGLGA